MKKHAKVLLAVAMTALLVIALSTTCFANGDVAGAIEQTWDSAKGQIKQVVNNVVFPVIDLVLAVCFFAKVATAYMDYPEARSVRVHRAGDSLRNAGILADCAALYLEDHRNMIRVSTGGDVIWTG